MRRHILVPMLALTLVVGACGTATPSEPRTVTKIVTATGTAPTDTGSSTTGTAGGITVVNPSGTGSTPSSPGGDETTGEAPESQTASSSSTTDESGSSSAPGDTSSSAPPETSTTSAATSTGADQKVNPLQASCTALLDAGDIDKALGISIPSSSSRIVDVANPDVKMTGKVKCYYGVKTDSTDRPVIVAISQYATADDAENQMRVTVSSETGLGAKASTVTVSGKQANILLRDGGMLILRYDTWTLAVAVADNLVEASALPDGLQKVATMVLARVLKNG